MRGPNEGPARTRRGVRGGGGKARRRLELYANRRGLTVSGPRRGTRAVATAYLQSATALAATDAARTLAGQAPAGQPVPDGPAAVGAGAAWRFLGPAGISNGQTYGSSRVTVSGRIAALAVDPANSAHLLVGSAGGGIWESADSGATWSPRTDFQPTLTTGALVFDPTQPGVAYAGTGEGNFYAWHGAGVMRSTDGGTTWSVLPDSPLVGQGFFDLAIDPSDNRHLLAATTAGMHDSTDGGNTWTSRRTPRTWALSVVQGEALAASADGVWASNDSAQTWMAVALPDSPTSWTRLAVAHAPSNPAVAYVWGATSSAAFLYQRSADGAWQAVTPPPGLRFNQAWYDWYVKVAPDRENQLYLGAIDIFRGDGGDGGWTWLNLSSKSPGDSIHPDQHVLVFDPADPNSMYAGSDGGLFRSPDRGITWQALNDGLGITEIEYLAQNSGSATWLLAGTQDNGTIRWTGSPKWEHVADGDGGGCGVDGATPTTVFHTFFGMGVARSNASGDFGSWSAIGPQVPASYQALFYPPTEVNRSTLAQAGQSTFISRDDGTSWTEVSLPAFLTASTLFLPNSDRVMVGTTTGRMFSIDWADPAWADATEIASPRAAWISDLFVGASDPSRAWVTYSSPGGGRLYRSDDGGGTWQDCSAGLPNLPLNAVEVDPNNANRVWVAADLGIYESLDAGATWSVFGTGLPNVLVEDLLFHADARLLRCGTRNRGVWEIAVD